MSYLGFPTTIHDRRTGALKGVVCRGDCGAPCWMADALAAAEGRRPTVDERLDSASDQLDGVLASMCYSGASWQRDLAADMAAAGGDNPLLARGYDAAREALSAAAMLVLKVRDGERDTGDVFDDYLTPIAGMVRAAGFYLQLDYDRTSENGRSWAPTAGQRAALDRVRQLVVELGHQLDLAERTATPPAPRPLPRADMASADGGGTAAGAAANANGAVR